MSTEDRAQLAVTHDDAALLTKLARRDPALVKSHEVVMRACILGSADCVRALFAAGVDPNARDMHQMTPFVRCILNCPGAVDSALEAGADLTLAVDGRRPLWYAVRVRDVELVNKLLLKGARPTAHELLLGMCLNDPTLTRLIVGFAPTAYAQRVARGLLPALACASTAAPVFFEQAACTDEALVRLLSDVESYWNAKDAACGTQMLAMARVYVERFQQTICRWTVRKIVLAALSLALHVHEGYDSDDHLDSEIEVFAQFCGMRVKSRELTMRFFKDVGYRGWIQPEIYEIYLNA
jgi:hypothetical protein